MVRAKKSHNAAHSLGPPLKLVTLLLATTLTLLNSAPGAESLKCACNVYEYCPDDFCVTTNSPESRCYMSVTRTLENGVYSNETIYGCLSGDEGSLSHLQCYANNLDHTEPKYIGCCRNEDFCNENLPGPNVTKDTRWTQERPDDMHQEASHLVFIRKYSWQLLLVCGILIFILSFLLIAQNILTTVRSYSKQSDTSQTSTCFLDADIEKFPPPHQYMQSSSASTQSYSVSDDLCHKPPPPPPSNVVDDSFKLTDLTSGIGEPMLIQRTMARAVGCGKTDHVGNGRFGRVFRGQYHGENVAVKAFRTIDQEAWEQEEKVFKTPLNHENIVRFISSELYSVEGSTTDEIWMFLEYCPYGSLCDYLDHNEVMGPQQAVKILFSIINGLNYLHEDYALASRLYKPSIAHRDIKSKNILMKTPDSCCIADFGHALIKVDENTLDYGKYQQTLQVGTIRYMAPEILRRNESLNYRQFSTFAQADLYQYGLILWEVCNRTALDILHPAGNHKLPYDGVVPQNPDIQDMVKIVCDDQYRPPRYDKWNKYPMMKRMAALMVECWRPNPKARMETLGVKKKLKEMYDQVVPAPSQQYHIDRFNNFWFRNDSNRTRSSDVTL